MAVTEYIEGIKNVYGRHGNWLRKPKEHPRSTTTRSHFHTGEQVLDISPTQTGKLEDQWSNTMVEDSDTTYRVSILDRLKKTRLYHVMA